MFEATFIKYLRIINPTLARNVDYRSRKPAKMVLAARPVRAHPRQYKMCAAPETHCHGTQNSPLLS